MLKPDTYVFVAQCAALCDPRQWGTSRDVVGTQAGNTQSCSTPCCESSTSKLAFNCVGPVARITGHLPLSRWSDLSPCTQGVYNATSKVLTMNGINATLANQVGAIAWAACRPAPVVLMGLDGCRAAGVVEVEVTALTAPLGSSQPSRSHTHLPAVRGPGRLLSEQSP
jgi:hypothetical protein